MTPELSRPVRIDTLGDVPHVIGVIANADERAALAKRFDLLALDRCEARTELTREGEAVIAVGTLHAEVVQACVASGEPVAAKIEDPFALRFLPDEDVREEVELDEADLDQMNYTGGAVDIGEAVAQTLALALDPFPRVLDADQRLKALGVMAEEETGPFAALKALKDKL